MSAPSSNPRQGGVERRCGGLWPRVLLALGVTVLGLLAAEGALRAGGIAPPPPSPVRVEQLASGELLFGLTWTGREFEIARVPRTAPEGARRIAMVGDSTVYGIPVRAHSTIPRLLEELLAHATDQPWEVVNLARWALAAHEVCALGDAALEHLSPELLLVYTGHNEFLPDNLGVVLAARRRGLPGGLERVLGRSALGRALLGATLPPIDPRGLRGPSPVDVTGGVREFSEVAAARPGVLRTFQGRLERLAHHAAAHARPLVLIGPASNGREYGPVGSAFSRPHEPSQRQRFAEHLEAAVSAFHAGRFHDCEAELDGAAAIDDRVAELVHLRSRLAWERGEHGRARALDLAKWGLDEVARAASDQILARIEAAARVGHAHFVPIGPALERAPLEGEPRLFLDQVHPSVFGQYLVAVRLAHGILELIGPPAERPWLTYEEVCVALAIPPEFLDLEPTFLVKGDIDFACWAFDPLPYLHRARASLELLDPAVRARVEVLGMDLYVALLEGDGERVLARAAQIQITHPNALEGAFERIERFPRLRTALERAGLEIVPGEPRRSLRPLP